MTQKGVSARYVSDRGQARRRSSPAGQQPQLAVTAGLGFCTGKGSCSHRSSASRRASLAACHSARPARWKTHTVQLGSIMILSSRDLLCVVLEILGLIFMVTVLHCACPTDRAASCWRPPCCGFLQKIHIGASMGIETIGQVSHTFALGTHET